MRRPISARALRTRTDEELVELCRGGNADAYRAIVDRYRDELVRHCARLVDPHAAEDAAQQALHKTYEVLISEPERELALRPWLHRVAHNITLNMLRDTVTPSDDLEAEVGSEPNAEATFEQRQRFKHVVGLVKNLPPRQRKALLMREIEGLSYDEIGDRMDESPSVIAQLIRRARTRLRERLAWLPLPLVRLLPDAQVRAKLVTTALLGAVAVGGGIAITQQAHQPGHRAPVASAGPTSRTAQLTESNDVAIVRAGLRETLAFTNSGSLSIVEVPSPTPVNGPITVQPIIVPPTTGAVGLPPIGSLAPGTGASVPGVAPATVVQPQTEQRPRPSTSTVSDPWAQYLTERSAAIDRLAAGELSVHDAQVEVATARSRLIGKIAATPGTAIPDWNNQFQLSHAQDVERVQGLAATIAATQRDSNLSDQERRQKIRQLRLELLAVAQAVRAIHQLEKQLVTYSRTSGRPLRVTVPRLARVSQASASTTHPPKDDRRLPPARPPGRRPQTQATTIATPDEPTRAGRAEQHTSAPEGRPGQPATEPAPGSAPMPAKPEHHKPSRPGRLERQTSRQQAAAAPETQSTAPVPQASPRPSKPPKKRAMAVPAAP